MKFIHFIAIITLCVKIGEASPLLQVNDNDEDEILTKDIISVLSDSSEESSSSSEESKEVTTTESPLLETHLYPIAPSAISQVPFLKSELHENFETKNGTQTGKIEAFGILSAFNLPWLADITFHKPDSAEQETLSNLNITVSGELFDSSEDNETTTIVSQHDDEPIQTTVQNAITTPVTKLPTITTSTTSAPTTTKSIKEVLIEKIAEIEAEPIILTQSVR